MKRRYVSDVLKGLGIGLIVGTFISPLGGEVDRTKAVFLLMYGAILLILGYFVSDEERR